jgi:hypothetical protein
MKVVVNLIVFYTEPESDKFTVGLIEDGDKLCLPEIELEDELDIGEAVLALLKQYVDVDPSWPTLVPVCFSANLDRNPDEREVALIYRTSIAGNVDIQGGLEWYTQSALRVVRNRVTKDCLNLILKGLN